MKTENELRILEIDKAAIEKKLYAMGAKFLGESFQKRYVYDLPEKKENEWIRLRTNGKTTTLTYKKIESSEIDGTKEIELMVNDFNLTNEFMEAIGINNRGFQENKRSSWSYAHLQIDIDSWPMIPTYMEIEGPDAKEIKNFAKKLDLKDNIITSDSVTDIYKRYGYDILAIKDLRF